MFEVTKKNRYFLTRNKNHNSIKGREENTENKKKTEGNQGYRTTRYQGEGERFEGSNQRSRWKKH